MSAAAVVAAAELTATAVVTGAGTGIGRAIAVLLAQKGLQVIAVGRRIEPLRETASLAPEGRILAVSADLADEQAPTVVADAIPKDAPPLKYLIHNAAVLGAMGSLGDLKREEFSKTFDINVTGPVFLTQKLLPKFVAGSRVLHISSGAAHCPLMGWSAYCSSKAAFHMVYQYLAEELAPKDIWVGSMRPGVVDTPMQDLIRTLDEDTFPMAQKFRNMKETGALITPDLVAQFTDWLLLDCPKEKFSASEWDIRDEEHHSLWK